MIRKGDKFTLRKGYALKVMAVEENWVMARYTGCAPFVMHMDQFKLRVEHDLKNRKP